MSYCIGLNSVFITYYWGILGQFLKIRLFKIASQYCHEAIQVEYLLDSAMNIVSAQ